MMTVFIRRHLFSLVEVTSSHLV